MFAITSTRIVGLIAVVCAVVVAPQALAVPITDSTTAAPTVVPPDAATGNDLSGFDLKAGFDPKAASRIAPPDAAMAYDLSGFGGLNGIRRYQQQEEYLKFLAQASIAADTHKSVKAAKKAAAIKALRRRSVALEAAYRKLHPDAYRPAVQKSDKAAVWNFPSCIAAAGYDSYKYSGDLCNLSAPAPTVGTIGLAPAIESDKAAVWSFPASCNGQAQAEFDHVSSGC
jgi:hypothetical protein